MSPGRVLDLVTVVYGREIELLRGQARSLDRYFDPAALGRILVVINDVAEAEVAAAVEAIRPCYGGFAGRVEVMRPASLFALRPAGCGARGLRGRLVHLYTSNRSVYPLGNKGGWRGNRGWSLQQALKLVAARAANAPYVLVLDAKNWFIRPVGADRFVAGDGRAMSQLDRPNDEHWSWILASFGRLGVSPPGRDAPAPLSITPFPITRDDLVACVDALEARLGPLETFFARKKTRETEFTLVHAWTVARDGDWETRFAPGLARPATIFRRDTEQQVDAVLDRAERGDADILSVHSARAEAMTPLQRDRLAAILAGAGLGPDR